MKWIGERISFLDTKQKVTIVIEPERNGFVNAMMGMWLAMWFTVGGVMIWSLFTFDLNEQENIILYVVLAFWLYYAVTVSFSFLWIVYGKELIKIDETALHYKRSVLSYGKSIPFYFENIKNFTFSVPEKGSFQAIWESTPWTKGGDRITFDYLGKVIKLGVKLNEKDTQLLMNFIDKKIKERIKR